MGLKQTAEYLHLQQAVKDFASSPSCAKARRLDQALFTYWCSPDVDLNVLLGMRLSLLEVDIPEDAQCDSPKDCNGANSYTCAVISGLVPADPAKSDPPPK